MNDVNYEYLLDVVKSEYSWLSDDDVKEVVSDIGDGWDWLDDDENMKYMINHIIKHTCTYTIEELINNYYDYWSIVEEENSNASIDNTEDVDCFLGIIQDRIECIVWKLNSNDIEYFWID